MKFEYEDTGKKKIELTLPYYAKSLKIISSTPFTFSDIYVMVTKESILTIEVFDDGDDVSISMNKSVNWGWLDATWIIAEKNKATASEWKTAHRRFSKMHKALSEEG